MTAERRLIVNADDFGLTDGVNRGIVHAFEQGIVTSASLMVRGRAAREAAAYATGHPALSLGLHVDLAEWVYRDDEWTCAYEVVPAGDPAAVAGEVARQVEMFRRLTGRDPAHLDSHQHVHRDEPLRSVLLMYARLLAVPLRHFTPGIAYCGRFYGQSDKGYPYHEGISVEALAEIIRSLPPGMTELCCHPGLGDDTDSVYRTERAKECAALCDPRIRGVLASVGVRLVSFAGALLPTAD